MTTYYNINPKFYVSVDCIIFGFDEGELKLLLLKRNFEPAMGKWTLMGGFVQEDESVDAAAKRVLAELTGLENVYMEQVGTFGDLERDPPIKDNFPIAGSKFRFSRSSFNSPSSKPKMIQSTDT